MAPGSYKGSNYDPDFAAKKRAAFQAGFSVTRPSEWYPKISLPPAGGSYTASSGSPAQRNEPVPAGRGIDSSYGRNTRYPAPHSPVEPIPANPNDRRYSQQEREYLEQYRGGGPPPAPLSNDGYNRIDNTPVRNGYQNDSPRSTPRSIPPPSHSHIPPPPSYGSRETFVPPPTRQQVEQRSEYTPSREAARAGSHPSHVTSIHSSSPQQVSSQLAATPSLSTESRPSPGAAPPQLAPVTTNAIAAVEGELDSLAKLRQFKAEVEASRSASKLQPELTPTKITAVAEHFLAAQAAALVKPEPPSSPVASTHNREVSSNSTAAPAKSGPEVSEPPSSAGASREAELRERLRKLKEKLANGTCPTATTTTGKQDKAEEGEIVDSAPDKQDAVEQASQFVEDIASDMEAKARAEQWIRAVRPSPPPGPQQELAPPPQPQLQPPQRPTHTSFTTKAFQEERFNLKARESAQATNSFRRASPEKEISRQSSMNLADRIGQRSRSPHKRPASPPRRRSISPSKSGYGYDRHPPPPKVARLNSPDRRYSSDQNAGYNRDRMDNRYDQPNRGSRAPYDDPPRDNRAANDRGLDRNDPYYSLPQPRHEERYDRPPPLASVPAPQAAAAPAAPASAVDDTVLQTLQALKAQIAKLEALVPAAALIKQSDAVVAPRPSEHGSSHRPAPPPLASPAARSFTTASANGQSSPVRHYPRNSHNSASYGNPRANDTQPSRGDRMDSIVPSGPANRGGPRDRDDYIYPGDRRDNQPPLPPPRSEYDRDVGGYPRSGAGPSAPRNSDYDRTRPYPPNDNHPSSYNTGRESFQTGRSSGPPPPARGGGYQGARGGYSGRGAPRGRGRGRGY